MLDSETDDEIIGYAKELWQFEVVLEEVDDGTNRLKIDRT